MLLTLHRLDERRGEGEGVAEVLAKVQEQIGRTIAVGALQVQVSCSIGVCVFRQPGTLPETLLKRADEAMYIAKRSGRNQIVYWTGAS